MLLITFSANFLESFIKIVTIIPVSIAFLISFRYFLKQKNRQTLVFLFAWFWYLCWALGNLIVVTYPYLIFYVLTGMSTILLSIFSVLFFDLIARETLDPLKLSIISALNGMKLILLFLPTTFTHSTEDYNKIVIDAMYNAFSAVILLLIGIMYVYFMGRIYHDSPANMKFEGRLCFIGAIFMGIIGPLTALMPNNVNVIVIGIGAIFTAIAFSRCPQLAYILPFKAYQITIIESQSGIPLFNHRWIPTIEGENKEELFSGMVQGIGHLLKESMDKGYVREIQVEHAILIIHRQQDYPFIGALVTSKSSPLLRDGLKFFAQKFYEQFKNDFPNYTEVDRFNSASELIKKCFPFIPEYK